MGDYEASIAEAYDRGVEAGRADAVPPGVEPMPWCEPHDCKWSDRGSYCDYAYDMESADMSFRSGSADCRRESKVAHWVTAKETI